MSASLPPRASKQRIVWQVQNWRHPELREGSGVQTRSVSRSAATRDSLRLRSGQALTRLNCAGFRDDFPERGSKVETDPYCTCLAKLTSASPIPRIKRRKVLDFSGVHATLRISVQKMPSPL